VSPGGFDRSMTAPLGASDPWPKAAWGEGSRASRVYVSMWPVRERYQHLHGFLRYPLAPLSARAARGFLGRTERAMLRFPPGLLDAVRRHAAIAERQSA